MPATFTLRRGLDEFHLCRRLEDCKKDSPGIPTRVRFYEKVSALVFIRSCITDPELERKLRLWLQEAPHLIQPDDEGNLLEHVANRIATGNLTVAVLKGESDPDAKGIVRDSEGLAGSSSKKNRSAASTPLADEMARRQQTNQEDVIVLGEAEPEEPETTWIEIELIEANGTPAANERYKLTLPDGSVKWGRLDQHGKARVERLQPGNCQVTFPDRDEQVWDVG